MRLDEPPRAEPTALGPGALRRDRRDRRGRAHPLRVALGWLALLAALAMAAVTLRWAGRLPDPHRWLAPGPLTAAPAGAPGGPVEALQAAATLVGWAVLAWLSACLALTWLARLPGPVGRLASRLGTAVTPGLLRRLAAAALGVGLATTPVVANATTADPSGVVSVSAASLDRPVGALTPAATQPEARTQAPPAVVPDVDVPDTAVQVRPGDSLWAIAARALGPQAGPAEIAAQWPRWYAANRAAIGPDPDLLHPGQWLHAP